MAPGGPRRPLVCRQRVCKNMKQSSFNALRSYVRCRALYIKRAGRHEMPKETRGSWARKGTYNQLMEMAHIRSTQDKAGETAKTFFCCLHQLYSLLITWNAARLVIYVYGTIFMFTFYAQIRVSAETALFYCSISVFLRRVDTPRLHD